MPAKLTTEGFKARSKAAHGDRYDYSEAEYTDNGTKIKIVCRKHGPFWQEPRHHMNGVGCQKCKGDATAARHSHDINDFIRLAKSVHGDRYDYSAVNYQKSGIKVEIVCRKHGPFWQRPNTHIGKRTGCPKCAGKFLSTPEFIEKAKAVHGDRFRYENTEYTTIKAHVTITCPKHGDFSQLAESHLTGNGCLQCWREDRTSKAETELAGWLEINGIGVTRNDRNALKSKLEIDIYIPSLKTGIEYNGCFWHSDRIEGEARESERKHATAAAAGIRLITVWDFDWLKRRPIVERHLLHALGINPAPRIGARECAAEEIGGSDANAFYADHHIQGACRGAVLNLGLKRGGELVAAMSFTRGVTRRGKTGDGEWELARYATSAIVRGGASKLFKAFIETARPKTVWSFSDNQHFGGGLYETLGFDKDGTLPADYRVIDPKTMKVWHKSQWQRKNIPNRLREMGSAESFTPDGDPRTERQMQDLTGALRVWDAGKTRWIWKRP